MRRKSLTNSLALIYFVLLPLKVICNSAYSTNAKNVDNSTISYQDTVENTEDDYFVLPFHLIDGFILIDVAINDKKGKLMFDTGTPSLFFLNNNKLKLDQNDKIAEGQAGSGQKIIVFKSDFLLSIEFDAHLKIFTEPRPIHANFDFIEKGITPEFLGFIGYEFFKDYEFILDYDNQVIEFFLIDEDGNPLKKKKNTASDNIVGTINFKNDTKVNIPEFQLQIGAISIPAYIDTGTQGGLTLTSETERELVENKLLEENRYSAWYGKALDGKKTFNLKKSDIQGTSIEKVKNLAIDEGKNKTTLGYQFLKLYKTVWNFKNRTITLLER